MWRKFPVYERWNQRRSSNCALPHNPDNYGYITGKYQEIMEIVKQNADLKRRKNKEKTGYKKPK